MTREDVIRLIVTCESRQARLEEALVRSEEPGLYAAATEHFGTWETALCYAGVRQAVKRACKPYSADAVLQKLRTLSRRGYDLSGERNRVRDPRLYAAAKGHFGTWRNALASAGIQLQGLRGFSKSTPRRRERIRQSIRARRQQGLSLAWSQVCLDNHALAVAAKAVFGSWSRALAAAETAQQPPSRWNKARVLEEICRRRQLDASLRYSAVHAEHPTLLWAAQRHWGGWKQALAAAGLAEATLPKKQV